MPFVFDLTKDLRYQAGLKDGIEFGIKIGIELGKKEFMKVYQVGIYKTLKSYVQASIMKGGTPEQVSKELGYPLSLVMEVFKEVEKENENK